MLVKWLEPVIESECEEINDQLLHNENGEVYSSVITIIKKNVNLDENESYELENCFLVAIRNAVEVSYRKGLIDGISIYRK
ncbi:hypothetical protein [Paenibacillus sp. HGF5]|uniref:hypothetical protein n=1 Tax=Paenibacillus sp. HGF5 TaxID=908341 RepID=UPI000207264A|nr:hypothetical protein [Paenibacillus sp. HGF5]EGG33461.1 conserved domain protein [Paenibacillus sp. HGF5]